MKRRTTLAALIARARSEDRKALRGKSDGFVAGWVKVKYPKELRK